VGELHDPLLPRWFVLVAVVSVPVAAVVIVTALLLGGRGELPLAERRPPPAGTLTSDVGELIVGDAEPVAYERGCPETRGVRIAGTDADLAVLRRGLAALCNARPAPDAAASLVRFAESGGVVRFALFERTGVDATADGAGPAPRILLNAKFTQTDPLYLAPLIGAQAVLLDADPATAEAALAARRVEDELCRAMLGGRQPSRACADAAELLALDDPLAALRGAGYR
jgi:hypothetical protein